jgi:hypothetical protein
MERHDQRLTVPVGETAALAAVLLEPGVEQATLEVVARDRAAGRQPLLEGRRGGAHRKRSAPARVLPGGDRAAESLATLGGCMALVVVGLDRRPVVPSGEALVDGLAETARVIGHGRLAESQAVGDLPPAEALSQKLVNLVARHEHTFARRPVGTCGDVAYTSRPQRRRPPILCGLV